MRIDFSKKTWNPQDFTQVTSLRTDGRKPFMQEEDCVVNDVYKENINDYNYISLLYKQTYNTPVEISTTCSFESFGAPLIVLTDDLISTEDGYPAYGHHFEIVAYEKGINVWDLNGNAKPIKAAFNHFEVPANEKLELKVKVLEDKLQISLYGQDMEFPISGLPSSFRCGITACEGVNRFYSFEVSSL